MGVTYSELENSSFRYKIIIEKSDAVVIGQIKIGKYNKIYIKCLGYIPFKYKANLCMKVFYDLAIIVNVLSYYSKTLKKTFVVQINTNLLLKKIHR